MPPVRIPRVTGDWTGRSVEFRSDRLVVSVNDGFPVESTLGDVANLIAQALSSTTVRMSVEVNNPTGRPWAIFKFAPLDDANQILQLAAQIAADRRIYYAEPAFIGHSAYTPAATETKYHANHAWQDCISLQDAWDITKGDSDVLLAILDSGISIDAGGNYHPDLDSARYLILPGSDYRTGGDVPRDDHEEGHGTHIAGIMSADGTNGVGTAGVNWVSDVYIARVLDALDDLSSEQIKLALNDVMAYATAQGKKRVVVNISLHVGTDLEHLVEMCNEASKFAGEIILCCATREYDLTREDVTWPAAYASTRTFIVAVGAVDGTPLPENDVVNDPPNFYNYDVIDIFAPGLGVHSTLPTYARGTSAEAEETDYGNRDGSSFAAPMVAGVASLLWSVNKGLSAAQVIDCMKTSADEFYYEKTDASGAILNAKEPHRRLNAMAAVERALTTMGETPMGVALVADRSGSMAEASGIMRGAESLERMDVLQEAAGILVDTIRVGDGLGVVGFSSDVDEPLPYADITDATDRAAIKVSIGSMSPGGATSIGGGVEQGVKMLVGAAQVRTGILVLTDGQENTAPMVADVIGDVDVPTYAIGMGTAEVLQPAPLEALTAQTGGYLLLTDVLDDPARYRVAKYMLQMLTELSGGGTVLDPSGVLQRGQTLSIPFSLCGGDHQCDVILMTPWPRLLRLAIVMPNDKELPARAFRRVLGSSVICHRFTLPVEKAHGGTWHALLSISEETRADLRVPWHLIVTSRSSIQAVSRAYASSSLPGATVALRTVVTRSGLPFENSVRVTASVRTRDQVVAEVPLPLMGQGVFEGTFVAPETGVYECLVRVTGETENGERFAREQIVTAHTWRPSSQPLDLDHARISERDRQRTVRRPRDS